MMQQFADARRFFSENDWRTILARMNARDTHPLIQFIKYGICGVGALVVHQAVWTACSTWLYPAIDSSLPKEVRALNSMYNNSIAVVFSTFFAYVTNVKWVFEQGRHHWVKELFYFMLVSLLSFAAGLAAGPFLIHKYGIHSIVAQGLLVVVSVAVNFVCRKFFVFKG
ncbi:MAG: GtrA family protein [Verrucomicrobiaceae bacterium]|jgi:putative flippase GtrA|nr:GtrA family protein [Verrucomicrobiaceae bacterium]